MTTERTLELMVETLTKVNEQQGRQIAELMAELKKMSAQIAWFQRQLFGRKSERCIAIDSQPGLFDDEELDACTGTCDSPDTEETSATEDETQTYTRRKGHKGVSKARETWENLPVFETRTIEPEGVDLTRYRRMGEETTYLVSFRMSERLALAQSPT